MLFSNPSTPVHCPAGPIRQDISNNFLNDERERNDRYRRELDGISRLRSALLELSRALWASGRDDPWSLFFRREVAKLTIRMVLLKHQPSVRQRATVTDLSRWCVCPGEI